MKDEESIEKFAEVYENFIEINFAIEDKYKTQEFYEEVKNNVNYFNHVFST